MGDPVVVAAVLGVLGTIAGIIGTYYTQRKKIHAEAGKVDSESDGVIVAAATDVVSLLREELQSARSRNDDLMERISALEVELAELRGFIKGEEKLRQENAELTMKLASSQDKVEDLQEKYGACRAKNRELRKKIAEG